MLQHPSARACDRVEARSRPRLPVGAFATTIAAALLVQACSSDAGPSAPVGITNRPPRSMEATPAEVVVAPALDTLETIGETVSLGAVVVGENGSVVAGVSVTWSSLAPGIAEVGATTGTVTAAGPGTATIVASAGPAVGEATIVVLGLDPNG